MDVPDDHTAQDLQPRAFARHDVDVSTLDGLAAQVAVLGADGTIVAVNAAWRAASGHASPLAAGAHEGTNYLHTCDMARGVDSAAASRFAAGIRAVLAGRQAEFALEYLSHLQHGQHWFSGRVRSVPGHDPRQVVVVHDDVTVRRRAEDALRQSEGRLRAVVDHVPVVLFALDRDGVYTLAEGKGLEAFGPNPSGVIGRSVFDLYCDQPEVIAQVQRVLAGEPQTTIMRRGGAVFEARYAPVHDDAGEIAGAIGVAMDITERMRAEEALHHNTLHDGLTGLPNRTLLQDRVEQAILVAQREGHSLAILVLDLDHFRDVNDTFGRYRGDLLLHQVATRLTGTLRATDTVARLGGDEFALLLPGANQDNALVTADKVHRQISAPMVVEDQPLYVGCSIGIALAPEHGEDPETLLRRAEVAMYVAKHDGKPRAVYSPDQDRHSPERLALTGALRYAIDHDNLILHYQPKMAVATGKIYGVEALVRWRHPQLGLLAPDQFIPLAERTGLVAPLTQWVLKAALRQCQSWRRAGLDLGIAVNLSAHSVHDPGLVSGITELLHTYGLPPSALRLELTESTLMADAAGAMETLGRLAGLGVHTSIDDFGTGYSSLAHLKRLPVDELKIDKFFVLHMQEEEADATIVSSTISLGHSLGLRVVAEGVENEATLTLLSRLRCDAAQGYYLSRPLPATQLKRWLQRGPWAVA